MADLQETGPNAENKGGGFRGGPKRWTGRGPRPARHIPWPEIFKHHISLIEGHQKMIDMVRKHTVEGTGNHRQICAMIERCQTMMYDAKTIARTFVPPANHRDLVPLGSSSASMYPGYSPADHIYGTAAMEYGHAAAKAKAEGVELKPQEDLEYEIGHGKGIKRKRLAEMRALKGSQDGSGSGSGSGTDDPSATTNGKRFKSAPSEPEPVEESAGDAQPAFYIDTKPTPVNLPFSAKKPSEQFLLDPEPVEEKKSEAEPVSAKKPKKAKKAHEGKLPDAPPAGQVETEDISAEVEARLKEKEEKRRRKEEKKRKQGASTTVEEPDIASPDDKKRKRKSEGSSAMAEDANGAVEKPKGKKSKKEKQVEPEGEVSKEVEKIEPQQEEPKKRVGEEAQDENGEGKKKKKKRKTKDVSAEA